MTTFLLAGVVVSVAVSVLAFCHVIAWAQDDDFPGESDS